MSYPRIIQPLVIEDEDDPRNLYDEVFQRCGEKFQCKIARSRHAFCLDDAESALDEASIYNIVILDLRLPVRPQTPADEGVEHGLSLVRRCATRHDYPIPVLLVISAHIDKADQRALDESLRAGFAYGRLLIKSANVAQEIEHAIEHALRYADVGIHVQDSADAYYPTLSPRDEDLLRRSVLAQQLAIGLDLEWWSAGYLPGPTSKGSASGSTKVLSGVFLLEDGSPSRRTFFKLTSSVGAEAMVAAARTLALKLSHIQICLALIADTRCLLATYTVTRSNKRPIALDTFLSFDREKASDLIPGVISSVSEQVGLLGTRFPEEATLSSLLWKHHDEIQIGSEWKRWPPTEADLVEVDVLELFRELRCSQRKVRYQHQLNVHGDLHLANIMVEADDQGARGYIFDAACTHDRGVALQDFAMLEVTALLHVDHGAAVDLFEHTPVLYNGWDSAPEKKVSSTASKRTLNTIQFIAELRRQVVKEEGRLVYALMVFDAALIQLGGLAYGVSRNKIGRPTDAATLCALVAKWLKSQLSTVTVERAET